MVRRVHRRAGPPRPCPDRRPSRGAEDVAFKSYIIANSKSGSPEGDPEGHRGEDVHIRCPRIDVRPSDAGHFPAAGEWRQIARRSVFEVGFSGDHSRDDSTGAVGRVRSRRAGLLRLGDGEEKQEKWTRRKSPVIWEIAHLPRLSMDHPRGRRRPLWSRVQGEGPRGASGYRRKGDPGTLRPVEIHRGEECRLRTHPSRGESHRSP